MHHTEEAKKRISDAMKGENNPNYGGKSVTEHQRECARQQHLGTKQTDETKLKISNSLKALDRHMTDEEKERLKQFTQRPVEREDGVVFESVTAAASSIGHHVTAIINAIRRHNRSGGYYWKYVDKA